MNPRPFDQLTPLSIYLIYKGLQTQAERKLIGGEDQKNLTEIFDALEAQIGDLVEKEPGRFQIPAHGTVSGFLYRMEHEFNNLESLN